jgi:hypothetical protein
MANYFDCRIFIKPQEGHTLPENFRDQFIGEDGEFTYAKTLPTEPLDERLDYSSVADGVEDNTFSLDLDTPNGPPETWLDHLAAENPTLVIECEYYETGYDVTGRLIWANGAWAWDRRADGVSHERREYFGEYLDRDDEDAPDDFPFVDEENRKAVEEVRAAHEVKDWLALMPALLTARHQLNYFSDENLDEDTLRVAIVTVAAAEALLRTLLTDPTVDALPLAAQFGCEPDDDDEADVGEPEEPATREDVLSFAETMATESARILSMSKHHEVTRRIHALKESVKETAS